MGLAVAVLTLWLVGSIIVSLILGRGIRRAQREEEKRNGNWFWNGDDPHRPAQ